MSYVDLLNGNVTKPIVDDCFICGKEITTEPMIFFKSCNHKYHHFCLTLVNSNCHCKPIENNLFNFEPTAPSFDSNNDNNISSDIAESEKKPLQAALLQKKRY